MAINVVMKALSDPTRRDILSLLRKEGEMAAGDIASKYDMTQATVSHHLSILLEADLITYHKEGKYIYYQLNMTVVQEVLEWIISLTDKGGKKGEK